MEHGRARRGGIARQILQGEPMYRPQKIPQAALAKVDTVGFPLQPVLNGNLSDASAVPEIPRDETADVCLVRVFDRPASGIKGDTMARHV